MGLSLRSAIMNAIQPTIALAPLCMSNRVIGLI